MRKKYNNHNSPSQSKRHYDKKQSPCYSEHHRYIRRDSVSSRGSSDGYEDSGDYILPQIESKEKTDFYLESVDSIEPLQKEFSMWGFIQTVFSSDEIKNKINRVHKLKKKIEYYICRLDKEKKNNVLIKFSENIDENELIELKLEFANTYSYVYFPYNRFDLILDYMNKKAEINSDFIVVSVNSDCNLNINQILLKKQMARTLFDNNMLHGYNTTSDIIRDKLLRSYIDDNLFAGKTIDINDLMDKFGVYGYQFLTTYPELK